MPGKHWTDIPNLKYLFFEMVCCNTHPADRTKVLNKNEENGIKSQSL